MAVKDNVALSAQMHQRITDLTAIIENMTEKRGKLFLDWMQDQNKYLETELSFSPKKLRKYNRGEVVFANFGFNSGAELGGYHYAVVMDDNDKMNPLVNVVPLGSLHPGQTYEDLHKHEVYVGVIKGLNGKETYAIPNQFRPISKLRIYRPKFSAERASKISSHALDAVDLKIITLFTKALSPSRSEKVQVAATITENIEITVIEQTGEVKK